MQVAAKGGSDDGQQYSPKAQISGGEAVFVCQRVEDNAFHPPKKKSKKSLAMPVEIVTNGVILQNLGGTMRKFKPRQPRSLLFRLLVLAVSGLLFTAAFVPGAKATLLVYFNFEDGSIVPNVVDTASDETPANPGGGIQHSTLDIQYGVGDEFTTSSLLPIGTTNQSAGDIDHPPSPPGTPGLAVGFTKSTSHNGAFFQFNVNATFFANMSLSYAVNTNGNGFKIQTWSYSTNGPAGPFTDFATFTGLTGLQALTAALPTGANLQPNLEIRVTFTGGASNGNDLQTIIDNIQLNGTVVPEPATVVGGLLGVLGLCWFQRRRLRLILPRLRRT